MTNVPNDIGDIQDPVDQDPLDIETPSTIEKAAEAAGNLNLGDMDPAERDRVFQYRAKPALDLFDKQQQQTNKYFQSQGLRFSSERRGKLLELTDQTFRNIGESVMVPQIEREQADIRANIGLMANIGATEAQTSQSQQQLDLQRRSIEVSEQAQALATEIGIGNLELGRAAQTLAERIQSGQLTIAQAAQELANQIQTGQLGVAQRQVTVQEAQALLAAEIQHGQLAVSQAAQALAEEIGIGQLELSQAAQEFTEQIQTGQLTLQQAAQALADRIQTGQLGVAQRQVTVQEAQQLLSAELGRGELEVSQAAQALAEQLGIGNLELGEASLELADRIQSGELTVAQAAQELSDRIQSGQLGVAERQVTTQEAALLLQGEIERGQLEVSQDAQALARQLGIGNLRLGQAAHRLTNRIQTGELSLAQAAQELADRIQTGQLGIADRQVTVSEAEQVLRAELGRAELALSTRGQDLAELIQEQTNLLQQGQLDVQERQATMQELNSAMERAFMQGQATGTYVDPETGLTYQTLAAQSQIFGQSLEERKTTVLELDAMMARAAARGDATGVFIDPVTGASTETIEAKKLELDERTRRAAAIGAWIEDDIDLDLANVFATLGLQQSDWLQGGNDPPGAGDNDADDVVDSVWDTEAEITFIAGLTDLATTWGLDEGDQDVLEAVTAELGVVAAGELFDRFSSGEGITANELWEMDQEAFYMLQDILVADIGDPADPATWGLKIPGATAPPPAGGDFADMGFDDIFSDLGSSGIYGSQPAMDAILALADTGGVTEQQALNSFGSTPFREDLLGRIAAYDDAQDPDGGAPEPPNPDDLPPPGDLAWGALPPAGSDMNAWVTGLTLPGEGRVDDQSHPAYPDLLALVTNGSFDDGIISLLYNAGKINNTTQVELAIAYSEYVAAQTP